MIRVAGGQSDLRYLLSVDASRIIVLNLSDPVLPPRVAKTLRRVAAESAHWFVQAGLGNDHVIDRDLRLSHRGLFWRGVQIAEWRDLVEEVSRPQLAEMGWPPRSRDQPMAKRVGIGTAIGTAIGLIIGRLWERSQLCHPRCDDPNLITTLTTMVGAGAGAAIGFGAGLAYVTAPQGIIYRADVEPEASPDRGV
jgi:hypothetical protein